MMNSGNYVISTLSQRTFGLSAEMVRLFVCLRETGWQPWFRGHQLARLLGIYQPYYRLAYAEFRPGLGTSVNSAVTNAAVDGYFNAGYPGVVLAGILGGLTVGYLMLLTAVPGYQPIAYYYRFYAIVVLCQLSILTVIVTLFPLWGMFAFDRIAARLMPRLKRLQRAS